MSAECVLVYSRYPELGRVKTRLIPSLSAEGATAIHRACLRATWSRWKRVVGDKLILVGTPDERQADFGHLLGCEDDLRFWGQGAGGLGERLARGFERAFSAGYASVVAIGTDSPTLPASEMRAAFEVLVNQDVALGPAEDGGYYLIGLKRFEPALFENVPWGSEAALSTTLATARRLNLSVGMLSPWYDVDTPTDLRRLPGELRDRIDLCPAERELLESLDALIESSGTAD